MTSDQQHPSEQPDESAASTPPVGRPPSVRASASVPVPSSLPWICMPFASPARVITIPAGVTFRILL